VLVDSHVHVVSRDHAAHPLRPNRPGLTWITEHACPADEYTALMDANGIGQAVLVQAMGAYTDDNTYCLESADADRRRFASVVYVDAHGDDPASALDRWVAQDAASTPANAGVDAASLRGVTGVRIVAITGPVSDPAVEALWAHAATRRIPIVATVLAPELVRLPELLGRFPDVPVALDHCGFPDLSGGAAYPAARPLFELAAFANLHAKVSTNALDLAVEGGGDPLEQRAGAVEQHSLPLARLSLALERGQDPLLRLRAHTGNGGETAVAGGGAELVRSAYAERAAHLDHPAWADPEETAETDELRLHLSLELVQLGDAPGFDELA
jgi:predicted TIM-barrel fold metal-dependent hydrolase